MSLQCLAFASAYIDKAGQMYCTDMLVTCLLLYNPLITVVQNSVILAPYSTCQEGSIVTWQLDDLSDYVLVNSFVCDYTLVSTGTAGCADG
jgi:hypothetical protein